MPAPPRPEYVKLLTDGGWTEHPVTGKYFPSYVREQRGMLQIISYSANRQLWLLWMDNGVVWEGGLDSCLLVADSK